MSNEEYRILYETLCFNLGMIAATLNKYDKDFSNILVNVVTNDSLSFNDVFDRLNKIDDDRKDEEKRYITEDELILEKIDKNKLNKIKDLASKITKTSELEFLEGDEE